MALDTRRCFWFGTEERASFYATPLKGADSSPSAWGADGTLLNGGGYGFNSFGSHKRYTYEWPQSSSPETAQMMKSYRDGTYGRGLLYFLEPGIYKTNVLPAAWADPSMAINNEAPSLVYNVDPIAVPTSGGADLDLPVTSALYDLSTTPAQTTPTPDTSVFLPIPTGHTLILGAFYTATGTGGVYATPVNNNGTLGANVKLTEKPNSDTEVVTDQFSGDIKGVRLWVGRTDATPSSVTIAAMSGRLLETSSVVVYTPWVVSRTNLSVNPRSLNTTGWVSNNATLNPITRGVTPPVSHPQGITTATVSQSTGTNSVLLNLFNIDGLGNTGTPERSPGVWIMVNETGYQTDASWGNVVLTPFVWTYVTRTSPVAAGSYATFSVSRTSGTASLTARAYTTGSQIESGASGVGSFFDGDLNPSGETSRTLWLGTPLSSASVLESRTRSGNPAIQTKLSAGPWIGGQGHSGCRFMGTPSYVNNGPVEGGRVGFAASFIEVGSHVYG